MAFDFAMFHEIAPTLKGSDFSKAMEVALLEQNIYTEYLEEIVCYSKKKDNAYGYNEERQRWIASQYSSTFLALKRLPLAFLQGRWDIAINWYSGLCLLACYLSDLPSS